ncbi:hypothetical protein IGX29_28260, partial [Streptomyces sp. H28]|uniref:FtsX-like permease family protein n=1 Tax=Streptomyces sp. H28 TaxID=2775865 RepID=UPI00199BB204|nr:hypothetical protein [Streptomyces sp. H28]
LVWLVLPALTRYALRDRTTSPGHRTTAGPARRRLVAEAALLLLAAAGVLALRVRGTASGPDPLLAAVPALLGLVTVAVLVRCLPPPLRLLARWAVRRRGAVALLAPARAARDAPARALALLVLVVTLAGAVFGQLVTGTLADGRREAAAWRAGADAAFLGAARHPGIAGQLARTDGVRGTVHVRQLRVDATTSADGDRYGVASLLAVDAARLRALAPGSRTARALDAARVTGPARGGETPVLATDGRVGDVLTHTLHGQRRRLRIVGTLPETVLHDPALGPLRGSTTSRDRLLLTDNRALGDIAPDDFEQTALLLYGPRLDVAALRALVPRVGAHAATGELRVRAEEEAEAAADGTVRVLVAAHTATTALTALLALLALVLDLTLSAPERTRTTAYLRTLGMPARSASALHVLQLLPLVLAAVAGGTALGLALPELLGPALSLRDVTGGPAAPAAGPDPVSVAALGGGLTLLVAVAAGLETFRARRRGAGAVLRLTEER